MKKRGQSQIISTVLIILLVLASIIIIWNVVKSTTEESSEKVDVEKFKLGAEIKYFNVNGNNAEVEIKRNSGEGKIDKILFILEDNSGKSFIYEEKNPIYIPNPLESRKILLNKDLTNPPINDLSTINSIEARFVFGEGHKEIISGVLSKESKNNIVTPIPDSPNIPSSNLIAHWDFNNGPQDITGNGHDGIPSTNPAPIIENGIYKATGGSGEGYLEVANEDFNFDINQDFSISIWAKRIGDSDSAYPALLGNGATGPSVAGWNLRFSNQNDLVFQIGDGLNNQNSRIQSTCNDIFFNLNKWHHIVVTANRGDKAMIYVDKQECDNLVISSHNLKLEGSNFIIGKWKKNDHTWNGEIDDIMIYNKILNQDNINYIYELQNSNEKSFEPISTEGLISHWRFEGNLEDSHGENDGTEFGSLNYPDYGNGKSAEFDGTNDAIQIGSTQSPNVATPLISPGSEFTLSSWVNKPDYPQDQSGNSRNGGVVGYYASSSGIYFSYDIFINGALAYCEIGDGDETKSIKTQITSDEWHHISCTWDGDLLKLYLNGEEKASVNPRTEATLTDPIPNSGTQGDLRELIGVKYGPVANFKFKGLIDEIRIYNRALSPEEVGYLANEFVPINPPST
jgi:hypothetical protein